MAQVRPIRKNAKQMSEIGHHRTPGSEVGGAGFRLRRLERIKPEKRLETVEMNPNWSLLDLPILGRRLQLWVDKTIAEELFRGY